MGQSESVFIGDTISSLSPIFEVMNKDHINKISDKTGLSNAIYNGTNGKTPDVRRVRYTAKKIVSGHDVFNYKITDARLIDDSRYDESFSIPDPSCFSFDAIATTPTGKKRCEDLVIGEHVLVDHKGTFEPILFFGHRENYETQFVESTLANGNKMSATPQHYIFSYNNKKKSMIPIQDVTMGDFVKYNGRRIKVAEIAIVRKKGIVSPMTKSCEIVIDGVQASCCTDKYTLAALKPLIDAVDALGITVPLQVVDPIRDIGNMAIQKFNL